MERYIKYKRFSEVHIESTIQGFLDKIVSEGWEIIYYDEMRKSSGVLSNTAEEITIHITVLAGKRQETELKHVL